jgi:pyruvate/2-oxoglutarate dehydrogenase complex dihydrolipoamide acyltransferase (E2) component
VAITSQSRLEAPFTGTVIALAHVAGDRVRAGEAVVIIEAMKMEHEVIAEIDGVVRDVGVDVGDTVEERQLLAIVEERSEAVSARASDGLPTDGDDVRYDLAAVRRRHAMTLDEARPDAVAGRHEKGHRTARENLDDLVDEGTFVEYGPLIFAAQEQRRSREDLVARTPADGLVAGVGDVAGR